MAEPKWDTCRDPNELFDYHRMKKDPRRLRLLVAACVRYILAPYDSPLAVESLDVVERYADGMATRAELLATRKAIRQAAKAKSERAALLDVLERSTDDSMEGLSVALPNLRSPSGVNGKAIKCDLIRCLYVNPHRPAPSDPAWLTSTVVQLARGIYEDRAFDRMPILADALQDAGCDSTDVLAHCRGTGPHARGCWVIDGLLRKT